MKRLLLVLWCSTLAWAAPTIQTVCAAGCTATSLQAAINTAAAANGGPQIIELKAGENFDTATGFTLPARSGSYTGWITLRSSRVSELPAKTRVTPADTAKLATLRVTAGGYTSVLYTTGHPTAYWRLEGLEFSLSTTGLNNLGWLIGLGYGLDTAENEPAKVSHHIVIDRCYIHGVAFDNGPRDGVRVNGDNVQVLNSYISEIKRDDGETHGILGYTFNGPLLVRNTFVGGAAIGSLIGGAPHTNVTIQPRNMTFLGNYYQGTPTHRALRFSGDPQGTAAPSGSGMAQTYWKTDTSEFYVYATGGWRLAATGITGSVCADGDFWNNTTAGTYFLCAGGVWTSTGSNRTITGGTITPFTHFWAKNKFELKAATGALVEGNLIENCYSPTDQSQSCGAILFNWVTDQDGPWNTIREVQVQNNLIRRTVLMSLEGWISSPRFAFFPHRAPRAVNLENNLVQDGTSLSIMTGLNRVTYYNYPPVGSTLGGVGRTLFSHGRFAHNTMINSLAGTNFWPTATMVYGDNNSTRNRVVSDNLVEVGQTSTAAYYVGGTGCVSLEAQWLYGSMRNNVIVQAGESVAAANAANYDTPNCRTWAFPWKRTGTGVRYAVTAASIAGGVLTITFGTNSAHTHGLLQGTKIKLAGWTPAGLNGTYTIPRLWCSSPTVLTTQTYQQTLCLPTAETGAVTPGTVEASVDYTDWSAQNFRLAATSVYKGWATDGSDPGANQDTVEWATATASSGVDNPYLDFRVRSISATADGAVFRYTAYSTAACTWRASSTRAFSDNLGSWGSETRIGRDGTVTVAGLSSNASYWYRVTCAMTYTRDGEFVTGH